MLKIVTQLFCYSPLDCCVPTKIININMQLTNSTAKYACLYFNLTLQLYNKYFPGTCTHEPVLTSGLFCLSCYLNFPAFYSK